MARRRSIGRPAVRDHRREWRSLLRRGVSPSARDFVHESIIGTLFDCRVEASTEVGNYAAILPSVAGWAQVTGHNTIYVDDRDPLAHGFQLA
jgi:4-hydroxyproline epimerase